MNNNTNQSNQINDPKGIVLFPTCWKIMGFSSIIESISISKKLATSAYLDNGKFPVIDQSKDFISGFALDESYLVKCHLPVLVFGDHTRVFKYINFPFIAGADGIKILKIKNPNNAKFIFYYCLILPLPQKGYSRHYQYLRKEKFPIPPVPEQERIVAKIETLFSELDAAEAALKRAQANLKRYKASMLKAACEGRLVPTEAELARKEGREYESASVLLERILKERRARWEQDEWNKLLINAKKKAAQQQRMVTGLPTRISDIPEEEWQRIAEADCTPYLPKNDKWKEKYIPPQAPDTEGLPELPEGWVWATVEQVADVGTGATPLRSNSEYWEDGTIPWVKSGALNYEYVTKADEFVTSKALVETNITYFPAGSLLIAMYGEGKTRGKVSELLIPATTNQAIAGLVLTESIMLKEYLKLYFLKNYEDIRRLSSGGVQPNLNLSIIKATPIPLPPLAEQNRITIYVFDKFTLIKNLITSLDNGSVRAKHLRHRILQHAFEGKLVPQDPNDEPVN